MTGCLSRILPQPSEIVAVSLPRPFGITFREDKRNQLVVVDELIPGSKADKLAKVSTHLAGIPAFSMLDLTKIKPTNWAFPLFSSHSSCLLAFISLWSTVT